MSRTLTLPAPERPIVHELCGAHPWPLESAPSSSRQVYAAAHVVAGPDQAIDWESTMAFRHHLWGLGFGIADAMDTAQRGMGMPWSSTEELIRRSGREARAVGGRLACGVGTDQLGPGPHRLSEVRDAYLQQLAVVEEAGAQVIVMASRQLVASAESVEDFIAVYEKVIHESSGPVILHWLGPMFDPQLEGYWGSADLDVATEAVLALIADHAEKVDGIKVSLLDADREVGLRRALPPGVRLYTGDDFNYPELIRGDEHGHSDALLGIFAAIAAPAAYALQALDRGDVAAYDQALAATVPLSRLIFETPTYHYKTGIVFLAWLAGHQEEFRMMGGLETARSLEHLSAVYRLADAAMLFPDPDLAVHRMRGLLQRHGFSA